MQSPYSTNNGANQPNNGNFGQPGQQATAANMINGLLTSPRPGGAPTGVGGNGISTIGGGLAGVASTYKGKGVKRYNDQEQYDKWEFYYDQSKDITTAVGAATATVNANQQQLNTNQQTPFGAQSTQGSGSGFTFGNNSNSTTQPTAPPAPPPPPTQ
jgi:hypothetical protein